MFNLKIKKMRDSQSYFLTDDFFFLFKKKVPKKIDFDRAGVGGKNTVSGVYLPIFSSSSLSSQPQTKHSRQGKDGVDIFIIYFLFSFIVHRR